jgi:hypothetical protein
VGVCGFCGRQTKVKQACQGMGLQTLKNELEATFQK